MWKPPSYWSKVSPQQPASYIIYKDGLGYVYAKNGETGKIDFRGTDAATVIQNAIDSLSGGKIFIKKGTYEVSSAINIKSNLQIVGEAVPELTGARFTATEDISIPKTLFAPCDAISKAISRAFLVLSKDAGFSRSSGSAGEVALPKPFIQIGLSVISKA